MLIEEFLNSLDVRSLIRRGIRLVGTDALDTRAAFRCDYAIGSSRTSANLIGVRGRVVDQAPGPRVPEYPSLVASDPARAPYPKRRGRYALRRIYVATTQANMPPPAYRCRNGVT